MQSSAPAPGTFRSIIPLVDELLSTLIGHGSSEKSLTSIEASEAVASKAKELHGLIEGMKRAAMELPGGHLTKDRVDWLTSVLEDEGVKRQYVELVTGISFDIAPAEY